MAELQHIGDENKPKLGEEVVLLINESGLFLCKDSSAYWIHLRLEEQDRLYLLKALLKDFLG